jgi:SAM-dependent methyltransferase
MPPDARLPRLQRLRQLFLDRTNGDAALSDYWRDRADLAAYAEVLAARIGWKWNAALAELAERGFAPPATPAPTVLDFGCGTGIAAERFAARWPGANLLVHDRSPLAMQFARDRLRALGCHAATANQLATLTPDVVLVSHVLGELDATGQHDLLLLLQRSPTVILVEAGNFATARRLATLRDQLLASHRPLAPCPHDRPCPTLTTNGDWCHVFAPPPPEVFTTGHWVVTARELGIDLRALPFAFFAAQRRDLATPTTAAPPADRILGRPDVGKHQAVVQRCLRTGTLDHATVAKRTAPELFRQLRKNPTAVRHLPGQPDPPDRNPPGPATTPAP